MYKALFDLDSSEEDTIPEPCTLQCNSHVSFALG
jgi:hypothetical protein